MYRSLVILSKVLDALVTLTARVAAVASDTSFDADRKAKAVRTAANLKALQDASAFADAAHKRLVAATAEFHKERVAIDAAHPYV